MSQASEEVQLIKTHGLMNYSRNKKRESHRQKGKASDATTMMMMKSDPTSGFDVIHDPLYYRYLPYSGSHQSYVNHGLPYFFFLVIRSGQMAESDFVVVVVPSLILLCLLSGEFEWIE